MPHTESWSGSQVLITRARRLWRAPLVSHPRRRPTRCRASPAQLSTQTVAGWLVWADILLDVIGGVDSALREGCPKLSEDHDRCFSTLVLGAFSTGVFNTNALPRINIDAYVWGESSIMTGVY